MDQMQRTSSKTVSPRAMNKAIGKTLSEHMVLVNQGLQKIKIDDNDQSNKTDEFPVSMGTVNDVNYTSTISPCSCFEEIETLKSTVKQLNFKLNKRNQLITRMKFSMRHAAVLLMTLCNNEEDDNEFQTDGNAQQSSVFNGISTLTSDTLAEDPFVLRNADNISRTSTYQNVAYQEPGNNEQNELVDVDIKYNNNADNEIAVHRNADGSHYNPNIIGSVSDKDNMEDSRNCVGEQVKKTRLSTTTIIAGNPGSGVNCPTSGKTLEKSKPLYQPVTNIHQNKTRRCHLCPEVFAHRSNLYRHIKQFHRGVRYKCSHCPGEFKIKEKLQRHVKRVHAQKERPIIQCNICGIHLVSGLDSHMYHMHKEAWTGNSSNCLEKNIDIGSSKN